MNALIRVHGKRLGPTLPQEGRVEDRQTHGGLCDQDAFGDTEFALWIKTVERL